MKIQISKIQGENQRKFEFSIPISVREQTYMDSTQARISPVASKIFGFPWADSVTVGPRWVMVTKQDWVDWEVLEEPLKTILEEHFSDRKGAIEENPGINQKAGEPQPLEPSSNGVDNKIPQQDGETFGLDSPDAKSIQKLMEEEINPALASHGGYVTLHSVKGDQAFIEMGGGCQGCAMSYMTLKEGIEEAIKESVPGIKQVVDVTDHSGGENPYF